METPQMHHSSRPVFGNKEWASHDENCLVGCSHDCRYCYAKSMAIRFKRKTPVTWKNEVLVPGKLQKGKKAKEGSKPRKQRGRLENTASRNKSGSKYSNSLSRRSGSTQTAI